MSGLTGKWLYLEINQVLIKSGIYRT